MRFTSPALATWILLLPALAAARPNPVAARRAPSVAPVVPVETPADPGPEPFARFNRFACSLSFGFGSASLGRLHDLGATIVRRAGISGDAAENPLQINAELALRYYFPYYVMAQVGYDTVYSKASSSVGLGGLSGTLHIDSLVMEVPILVGGYYPLIRRLYVYAAAGPAVFFYPRSFFDIDPNFGLPDFKADSGVGAHVLAGADFLITEVFAVGLELRYRYVKTGDLMEKDTGIKVHEWLGEAEPYNLDFSGVSLGIILRFYVI